VKEILTTCPYCGVGCNFYLQVENGEVKGLRPSKEHPINQGSLCPKGATVHQVIHHPSRLKRPLIKEGGSFREASWDEAYGLITEKFGSLLEKYGGESLGLLSSAMATNEDNYLAQKFARAVLKTNNIDQCARLCHASTIAGLISSFGSGAMTNSIAELADPACLFIIGSNSSAAHPIIANNFIKKALQRGAALIVADPRGIEFAKRALVHLPLKPGTDIALLNTMMNYILEEGLHDEQFIEARTEGFEQLREALRSYTLERGAALTGLPAEDIKKAAELYAKRKPASIVYCMGITQHQIGTGNVISIANLAMLTGNVGRESSGVNPLRGKNNVQGACDMGVLPEYLPGYRPMGDEGARREFESAWGVRLPEYQRVIWCTRMWDEILAGRLKGLYIIGENIAISEANLSKVERALRSLEFLVVQEVFLTETAEFADVVLPACTFAEKDGTFTSTERRVQRVRKAIEPLGESKPDWLILCELAQRMGYPMDYDGPEEVMDEIRRLVPSYRGISYKRLEEGFGLQWPCPSEDHPGTKFLHKERFTRGLGRFQPVEHRPPAEEPDEAYPLILTTGRILMQYGAGSFTRRTPSLERANPENFVEINPEDARRLKITDGDRVRIISRRGEIEAVAKLADIRAGTIWMPYLYRESPANRLTNDALDPICGIPEFKACAARIEPKK
jgi:formate dehydrogenase alpha subunit